MASSPSSAVAMAAFVSDDETILNVAAVNCDDLSLAFEGAGFMGTLQLAQLALENKWKLVSFNGLNIFERAFLEMTKSNPNIEHAATLKSIAILHNDMAFDFLIDNGYPLTWDMLLSECDPPETAVQAAQAVAAIFKASTKTGCIKRTTMAGNTTYWPLIHFMNGIPHFRSVKSASVMSKTYPPDQSWMTHDVPDLTTSTLWLK